MKRKLILLDLVLLALTVAAGWHVRERWEEARKRESVVLRRAVKTLPPPPYSPLPRFEPLAAANYSDIALKMLFTPDRNPTVVIEVAPPKPMPPLPVMHGVMNLGDGPTVIMSARPGARQEGFRVGQQVGEFKLVAIDRSQIVFEWDGHEITKRIDELLDHSTPQAEAPARAAEAPAAAPPPVQAVATGPKTFGPGNDVGAGKRACQPDDPSPDGTVKDGFRKVVVNTPFGKMCRWDPVAQQ